MNRVQHRLVDISLVKRKCSYNYEGTARDAVPRACRPGTGRLIAVKPHALASDLRTSWQGPSETVRLGFL